nr:hypothetical protein L203_03651 [Cryptococcus depauperatus CBS 7841]
MLTLLPFLQSVPLATRVLTALLILTTLTAQCLAFFFQSSSPWLVLQPSISWKYPWTLLTAGFVELSFVNAIISSISLPLACRYLEKVWGPRELVRFCCITIVGSNVIAFGFSWMVYLLLGSEDALNGLPYHGLSGLQVGFLVAFTQLIPEHQVQLLGKFKLRVKTLPGIHLLLSNVLVLFFGPSPFILIQFGFFVAWVYLRFFKLAENGEFRGDRSETFAFQYWFPTPIRPFIATAGNHVFRIACRFGIVQAWDEPTGYGLLPGPGGPSGARAEAERRRALALKALDARLATSSPAPVIPASANSATTTTATETVTTADVTAPAKVAATAETGAGAGTDAAVKEELKS